MPYLCPNCEATTLPPAVEPNSRRFCTKCAHSFAPDDCDIRNVPMEPTVGAIDAWLTNHTSVNGWPTYGVDIKTKSGSWRNVIQRVEEHGYVWYWTIRGEGSSNEGRETAIRADRITQARKYLHHYPEMEKRTNEVTQ